MPDEIITCPTRKCGRNVHDCKVAETTSLITARPAPPRVFLIWARISPISISPKKVHGQSVQRRNATVPVLKCSHNGAVVCSSFVALTRGQQRSIDFKTA
jgi:hypothetical protein